jgi:predicted secreted protein
MPVGPGVRMARVKHVRQGDEFRVTVADRPGAGYEWTATKVPDGLVLLGSEWAEPVPPEVGGTRARSFRFRAGRQGSFVLVLELVRPWEPRATTTPVERLVVEVVVEPSGARGP